MATIGSPGVGNQPKFDTKPELYTTVDTLLEYNKPDNRDLLIKTYGDQGITGFLKLTGAIKNAGTADSIQYWEEQRRHRLVDIGTQSITTNAGTAGTVVLGTDLTGADQLEAQTVVMNASSGEVYIMTDDTAGSQTFKRLDGGSGTNWASNDELIILGNMYYQGTEHSANIMRTTPDRRSQSYMILKDRYEIAGTQATNIGWVNVGGGEYRWYVHGEQETRRRFEDKRELMMLFAEKTASSGNFTGTNAPGGVEGSEGYFSAVDNRGIVISNASANPLDSFAEFDSIILELDKQGAPSEYAMYVNRTQSLAIDDMLASGIATNVTAGLAGQFGAFNNDADMAVQLGFKSFTRGGYTFHKHDWKLMNDPTLLGASTKFVGAMVPMTQVTDPVSGAKAPALEMNYKESNGYSRELEHWVRGGGVLGHNELSKDILEMNYRSEIALVTRAANQHVIIKG